MPFLGFFRPTHHTANMAAASETSEAQLRESAVTTPPLEQEGVTFFYGEGCPYTTRVLPDVECLETAMTSQGRKLGRREVWHDEDNQRKYIEVARGKCRGVPFFVNEKTGRFVCGAAPCSVLKERLL